jgi:hypothetical protein
MAVDLGERRQKEKAPGNVGSREPRRGGKERESLDAEGAAAAAGGLDVRVVELEAGAFDALDVVNGDAIEIHFAHLVHEDFEAVEFVYVVAGFVDLVLEGHVVAEAGAASADHGHAQTGGNRVLRRQDFLYFRNSDGAKLNHSFILQRCAHRARQDTKDIISDAGKRCVATVASITRK